MNKALVRQLAILALVLLMFGIVGKWDFEDEELQAVSYCENVKSGLWPDYQGTYKSECSKIFLKTSLTFLK